MGLFDSLAKKKQIRNMEKAKECFRSGESQKAIELFHDVYEYDKRLLDAEASYMYGKLLHQLPSNEKSEHRKYAFRLYGDAAEQGMLCAQQELAEIQDKLGNQKEALYYYQLAADSGDQNAAVRCRQLIEEIKETQRRMEEYEKRKETEFEEKVEAIVDAIRVCTEQGKRNRLLGEADRLIHIHYEIHPTQKYMPKKEVSAHVGDLMCEGLTLICKQLDVYQLGTYEYFQAAMTYGSAYAYGQMGDYERDQKQSVYDAGKTFELYRKAAEGGDAHGQLYLGIMYRNGLVMPGPNPQKALYWIEKAAKQGEARANYICYEMYQNGEGTEQNLEKALIFYAQAAKKGWTQDYNQEFERAIRINFYNRSELERTLVDKDGEEVKYVQRF